MKRLYLVGKSRDNAKLYFARSRDAKSGRLEVPITDDLLEVLREAIAEREAAEGEAGPEQPTLEQAALDEESGRLPVNGPTAHPATPRPQPRRRRPRGGLPPGSIERATQMSDRGVEAVIRKPPDVDRPPEPERDREPPSRSRLTPAEIQRLLRAGRGVRSVARRAQASEEWVRRLGRPIESERVGVVLQLLRANQARPDGGRSAIPIGAAITEHLREQGVPFPERVVEQGWTATRPEGGAWRVRFAYTWRGRRHRAVWCFDPQSGEASPANDAAAILGSREAPAAEGSEWSGPRSARS